MKTEGVQKRIYTFRGWRIFDNKWVFGDLSHDMKVTSTGVAKRVKIGVDEVAPESVGISTDLVDGYGNEIFEDDIIEVEVVDCFNKRSRINVVVKWLGAEFAGCDDERGLIWNLNWLLKETVDRGKVLGNVYEKSLNEEVENS